MHTSFHKLYPLALTHLHLYKSIRKVTQYPIIDTVKPENESESEAIDTSIDFSVFRVLH